MGKLSDLSRLPEGFSGKVRLFPLPNVVLFPHLVQPLHIFEPRYRAMMKATLEGDSLMATALLLPGFEHDYQGRPPVAGVVCIGRVLTHEQLPDGRFNLLLLGLKRAAILQELPPTQEYREAAVSVLEDYYPCTGHAGRERLARKLMDSFRDAVVGSCVAKEQLALLREQELGLGEMTDVITYSLDLPVAFKQSLLSECNVDVRARRLVKELAALGQAPSTARGPTTFPPGFSVN